MSRKMRVVAPFRPFQPESDLHKSLGDFDWIEALQMMVHSAEVACACPVVALTDVDTELPVKALKYDTTHRRLMLWTLEVCLAYIESKDFDRNTVMLDVDQLVYAPLAPWFKKSIDLTVLIRPEGRHNGKQPFLNGVQWWNPRAKLELADFYRRALRAAEQMPEEQLVWGADTNAVGHLLKPIERGIRQRSDMRVWMVDNEHVLETFATRHEESLKAGKAPEVTRPILDFRWNRKPFMPAVYKLTHGAESVAW